MTCSVFYQVIENGATNSAIFLLGYSDLFPGDDRSCERSSKEISILVKLVRSKSSDGKWNTDLVDGIALNCPVNDLLHKLYGNGWLATDKIAPTGCS